MDIRFFDDPLQSPRAPEDVRILQIGLFIYPEGRRLMFGIELTPFRERPSIDVRLINGRGEPAGSLSVIETMTPNFSLNLHLRDREAVDPYELTAVIYYAAPDRERTNIDTRTVVFATEMPGEQLFKFTDGG